MTLGLDQAQAAIDRATPLTDRDLQGALQAMGNDLLARAWSHQPRPEDTTPPLDEATLQHNRALIEYLNKPFETFGQQKVAFSSEEVQVHAERGNLEAVILLNKIELLRRQIGIGCGPLDIFLLNVGSAAPPNHKFYDLTFKHWIRVPSLHPEGVARFRLIRRRAADALHRAETWYVQDQNIVYLGRHAPDEETPQPGKRLLDLE